MYWCLSKRPPCILSELEHIGKSSQLSLAGRAPKASNSSAYGSSPGKLQEEAWGRNYGAERWLVVGMPAPDSSFPDVSSSLATETPFKNTTQPRHSPFKNSSGFSIPAPLSFSLPSKLTLCSCTLSQFLLPSSLPLSCSCSALKA